MTVNDVPEAKLNEQFDAYEKAGGFNFSEDGRRIILDAARLGCINLEEETRKLMQARESERIYFEAEARGYALAHAPVELQ